VPSDIQYGKSPPKVELHPEKLKSFIFAVLAQGAIAQL
jgi:hypothetical protein